MKLSVAFLKNIHDRFSNSDNLVFHIFPPAWYSPIHSRTVEQVVCCQVPTQAIDFSLLYIRQTLAVAVCPDFQRRRWQYGAIPTGSQLRTEHQYYC
jgi:hypothetical protein